MKTMTSPLPMVFSDPGDLDAFIAAVEDHADAPHLVLRVVQGRALAALHASGAAHITPDNLPFYAASRGLDVIQEALVDLAYRCGQREPMTAAEIARLRVVALTACAWQEYAPGAKLRRRLADQLPGANKKKQENKELRRVARDKDIALLTTEAKRLRKLHPRWFKKQIIAELKTFCKGRDYQIHTTAIEREVPIPPRR